MAGWEQITGDKLTGKIKHSRIKASCPCTLNSIFAEAVASPATAPQHDGCLTEQQITDFKECVERHQKDMGLEFPRVHSVVLFAYIDDTPVI